MFGRIRILYIKVDISLLSFVLLSEYMQILPKPHVPFLSSLLYSPYECLKEFAHCIQMLTLL